MDNRLDRQTDICFSRVAFATDYGGSCCQNLDMILVDGLGNESL